MDFKSAIIRFFSLLLLIAICTSCMSSGLGSDIQVGEDNVFISPNNPDLKISIDKKLKYIGSNKNNEMQKANNRHAILSEINESYYFCELKNNAIRNIVVITFSRLTTARSYYTMDMFGKPDSFDYYNKITLGGKKYINIIQPVSSKAVLKDYNYNFLNQKGINLPEHSVLNIYAKRFGGTDNKRVIITYMKDILLFDQVFDKEELIKAMQDSVKGDLIF